MTRAISFDSPQKAKDRWERFFKGRPGCELQITTGDSYEEDEDHPINRIVVTADLGRAWDRALDAAQAVPKTEPNRSARQQELINKELDAVSPRAQ